MDPYLFPTDLLTKTWLSVRPHLLFVFFGIIFGLFLGYEINKHTPPVYEAKGTFLVNKLPFANDEVADPETNRQLVASLIQSMAGESMRHEAAKILNSGAKTPAPDPALPAVPDSALAFADHDTTLTLSPQNPYYANVEVTNVRNSRLGQVTAQTGDPQYSLDVVNAIFTTILRLNAIAGRVAQLDFSLKLNNDQALTVLAQLDSVSSDRGHAETQNQALDQYLALKYNIENFPAFSSDPTLSNLKTQMILVQSEYDNIAAQSTSGARLLGKKSELESLRGQMRTYTSSLVRGLRSTLQTTKAREDQLKAQVQDLKAKNAKLQEIRASLTKGYGDFTMPEDPVQGTDQEVGGSSIIVVIDQPYTVTKPVKPILVPNLILGVSMGFAIGLGLSLTFQALLAVRRRFTGSASVTGRKIS